ncbi:MAG: VWA domain-containing protein [Labilithrix sp.]|nr:VWA domain-containing protein [Labilithrix sp.]
MSAVPPIADNDAASASGGIAASIGVSMVLHLALLGTFAAVGGFDSTPVSEPPIEAVWQAPDEEFMPVNLVMQPVAAHGPSTPGNLDDPLAPQFEVDVSAASLTAGGGQGQGLPGRSVSASDLRRSLGRGLAGTGAGSGEGKGDGGGRGFFGRGVAGQRVVYVVDSSRSMNHPHPGEGKTRLGRVKLELINAIKALQPEQKFFIVFFNDAPIPMPSDRLVEANDATKLQFLRWMVDVPASGQTDPAMALLLALKLNPDTIYFLTDGDVEEEQTDGLLAVHAQRGDALGRPRGAAVLLDDERGPRAPRHGERGGETEAEERERACGGPTDHTDDHTRKTRGRPPSSAWSADAPGRRRGPA